MKHHGTQTRQLYRQFFTENTFLRSVSPFSASMYPKTVEIDSTQGGKRTAEYHDPHHVVFRLRTATQGFSCCLKTVTKLSLIERKQVTSLLRFTSALHGLKLLTTFKETKIGCAKRVNGRLAVLRSSLVPHVRNSARLVLEVKYVFCVNG